MQDQQQQNQNSQPLRASINIMMMSMNGESIPTDFGGQQFQFGSLGDVFNSMSGLFGNQTFTTGPNGQNFSNFQDVLDYLMQQHEPNGPPPAAKNIVEKLPEIIIGKKEVSEKWDCAVCKELFEMKETVLQLPCEHCYHQDCIRPWLSQHNTCPICRYELPVEDEEYETKRKERMSSRNIREELFQTQDPDKILEITPIPDIELSEDTKTLNDSICAQKEQESSFQHKKCDLLENSEENCILLQTDQMASLSCGHHFHKECLETYFQLHNKDDNRSLSSTECPVCQQHVELMDYA